MFFFDLSLQWWWMSDVLLFKVQLRKLSKRIRNRVIIKYENCFSFFKAKQRKTKKSTQTLLDCAKRGWMGLQDQLITSLILWSIENFIFLCFIIETIMKHFSTVFLFLELMQFSVDSEDVKHRRRSLINSPRGGKSNNFNNVFSFSLL